MRITQLAVQILARQAGANHQHRALRRHAGNQLRLDPVDLLLILVGVAQVDAVVHDDQVRACAVHVGTHTERLHRRVLLTRIAGIVRHVDHRLIPRLRVLIEPAHRGIPGDHVRIRRMRQPRLDRVQHLLRHVLRLRHQQDPDIRIHTDPIRRIVHRDGRGLRMLRGHVRDDQIPLARLPRHRRMHPARRATLNQVDHVLHMREHLGPKEPLRELRELQELAPHRLVRGLHHLDPGHRIPELAALPPPRLIRVLGATRQLQRLTDRHPRRQMLQKPLLRRSLAFGSQPARSRHPWAPFR